MAERTILAAARPGRRRLRLRVVLVTSLLGLSAVPLLNEPAAADVGVDWAFDTRADGMPSTDVPARTIEQASATIWDSGEYGTSVHASVVLAGTPDDASAADLHLALGVPDNSGGCLVRWEVVVPTLDPTGAATRDGSAIALDHPLAPGEDYLCGYVAVTPTGATGPDYDRWDGHPGGQVVADSGGRAVIKDVQVPERVRPHRWVPVRMKVKARGSRVDAIRVAGYGRGVRAVPTLVPILRPGGSAALRLWVRLGVDAPRRVDIVATPYGVAFPTEDHTTVVLHPR